MKTAYEDTLGSYGVTDLVWEFEESGPGNSKVQINGTIQEVARGLKDRDLSHLLQNKSLAISTQNKDLPTLPWGDIKFCGPKDGPFPSASTWSINEGIDYLRGIQGMPTNGPGPGNCGRVSCEEKSAIWWCNDVSGLHISEKLSHHYTVISALLRTAIN